MDESTCEYVWEQRGSECFPCVTFDPCCRSPSCPVGPVWSADSAGTWRAATCRSEWSLDRRVISSCRVVQSEQSLAWRSECRGSTCRSVSWSIPAQEVLLRRCWLVGCYLTRWQSYSGVFTVTHSDVTVLSESRRPLIGCFCLLWRRSVYSPAASVCSEMISAVTMTTTSPRPPPTLHLSSSHTAVNLSSVFRYFTAVEILCYSRSI